MTRGARYHPAPESTARILRVTRPGRRALRDGPFIPRQTEPACSHPRRIAKTNDHIRRETHDLARYVPVRACEPTLLTSSPSGRRPGAMPCPRPRHPRARRQPPPRQPAFSPASRPLCRKYPNRELRHPSQGLDTRARRDSGDGPCADRDGGHHHGDTHIRAPGLGTHGAGLEGLEGLEGDAKEGVGRVGGRSRRGDPFLHPAGAAHHRDPAGEPGLRRGPSPSAGLSGTGSRASVRPRPPRDHPSGSPSPGLLPRS